jgi:nucleoside-diphosphate-sugar epimerase
MEDVRVRTILVTGAAGYVGGLLVRRLLAEPDTRVIAVDACAMAHGDAGIRDLNGAEGLEVVRSDVRDTAALAPLLDRADAVVHLAAIVGDPAGRRDPELTREVNQHASERLITASGDAGVGHFIFVSTCSNYGVSDGDRLVTEDADLNPVSLYAETKVAVEQALTGQDAVPYTCLRLATVYGVAPRMRFDLTVNQFAIEAHINRRLSIYGEQFWRPYVHVEDVGRAISAVLDDREASRNRTFNVGDSDENYTKGMMYELLVERLPGLRAEWVSIDEDPRSYKVSFERIRETLGYEVSRRVPHGMDEILGRARQGEYPDPRADRFRN